MQVLVDALELTPSDADMLFCMFIALRNATLTGQDPTEALAQIGVTDLTSEVAVGVYELLPMQLRLDIPDRLL